MARFILNEADHERISDAVSRAEAKSNGEIVTLLAASSDAYHDVGLHYAIGASFALVGAVWIWPTQALALADRLLGTWGVPGLRDHVAALLMAALTVFLLVRYALAWAPLRMALTPAATKLRRVRRAAIGLFRAAVDARTTGRTGVLLYVSLAEHRAEIIGDAAITTAIAPEAWGEAMATLIDHIRQDRAADGMVSAIDRIGDILATHVPRSANDVDELPNRLIEL